MFYALNRPEWDCNEWLEDIHAEESLTWVRQRNEATLTELGYTQTPTMPPCSALATLHGGYVLSPD
jgi:hypothetical protein